MSDLSGKYALVTGGGTGIGFGIAVRLLEAGATVTIAGRREDVLENSANELRDLSSSPDDIRIAVCDVTNEDDVKRAVDTASNDEGVLNISVANAGIGAGGPFLTMDAETFRSVLEVNVVGAFNTIQASAATMRETGGSIIAISSIAGALGGRFRAAYSSSKAALDMLVRSSADELGGFGIRINSIRPGVVRSEATAMMFDHLPHIIDDYKKNMPLGRVGEPEEVGDAVVWLAGDQSTWVTGQNIAVDGGHTLRRAPDLEPAIRARLGEEEYAKIVRPGSGPNG
ncbi:MAG: SDR family NAD(P)-dependent oxidoreductase [Acidimicrobiales bacterium]|jgi:NAD(P)-dependent dehydrogenase (short-subunit alcohol dehydrogenase family)|nr:SDR family NAD(P)-dependent oxidoreductase [Acidimicrobiales bacterium]MDP6299620.1 SDR family NAD(P)-dependent oxidoreductase [Acidimicrobiales bacterium]